MKWLFGSLVATALVVVLWWFTQDGELPQRAEMMPWQVEVDESGASTVFGVTLRKTTLAEAVKQFGREGELALFSRNTDNDRLEAYFSNIQLGPVTAKVFVSLDVSAGEMAGLRERSIKQEAAPSGIYRYTLGPQDTVAALQRSIQSITYIPSYLRLDEDMIRSKFGEPETVVRVDDEKVRWFYGSKGLAVLIDQSGKEILQYVPLTEFDDLKKRLDQVQEEPAESDA